MAHGSEREDPKSQVEGRYANYLEVGHNRVEFWLVFGQLYSGSEVPYVHTHVITSPSYLKSMLRLLTQALEQYEEKWGTPREEDPET